MSTLTASEARANLYRLIDQTNESHQPIHIAGKRTSALLVSSEDWQAIQETLHPVSYTHLDVYKRQGLYTSNSGCPRPTGWPLVFTYRRSM